MNQRPPDKIIPFAPTPKDNIPFAPAPKENIPFAPTSREARDSRGETRDSRGGNADNLDHTGHSIVAMLQQAVDVAKDNCDRAMDVAHKLSMQLRQAEDRVVQLEAEVRRYQERAVRAENCLLRIHNEIEDRFFTQQNATPQQAGQQPAQR
jgi:hypothetical protein